jgi:hypothetical protein
MSKWLRFSSTGLMIGVLCGLGMIACVRGEARAGTLQITISEGATSYNIMDEGPLDTLVAPPPDNINKIQALAAALIFPDYKVVNLGASTNNPGVSDVSIGANLTVNGEVQRITSGAAPNLVISVTDTDYSQPGAPRFLQSSMSTTFTGAPTGDTRTFTSWYNPTNAPYATDVVQGPPVPLSYSSTGLTLNSHGDTAAVVPVPFAALYGLTNTTTINLSANGADIGFSGSTSITSIPEPASMSLLALGLPLMVYNLMRRRRA